MGLTTAHVLEPREYKVVYASVFVFAFMHVEALYGMYLAFTVAKWSTLIFAYVLGVTALVGVTAGAHRLWTHRAFKATMPLQILLMLMNSIAYQWTAYNWIRDHRMHHKYSDTDADPHDPRRGFFFAHIGWCLVKKHPELLKRSHTIDMSDIQSNPVVMFQKKYALPVIGSMCFLLPTLIPVYCWQESLSTAWHVNIFRYFCTSHIIMTVNSVAHVWGYRPYDKHINPVQSPIVSILAMGEGFHNYHHAFPWDYRTAEVGNNWLNPTTLFIDFFAWIGWAYDMKTASDDILKKKMERSGDGSDLWGRRRQCKLEKTLEYENYDKTAYDKS